ncbi:MAG: GldG family protein [Treponema sp.]|jgi:ABC-type uncharacterized transport system involved in gliding motility auxiliary subunit|nr:GldG family protein [Treponema sp.]
MKKNQARLITFLSLVVFLFAFLLSGRLWFRLDLTKNKANTISDVSRSLYREISDQVRITYFVSEKLSRTYPMPGEIADLLREYAARSWGRIRFIQKDPAKEEVIRAIEGLGIIGQQIQVAEKNETTVAIVYSGILIEYLDREAVIPFVFALDTLEYDISSRIRSLVRNVERELGVIVGDAHKQWNTDYGLLNRELVLSGFKVRLITPGEEIPTGLTALFVLGGAEDLDDYCLYLIDRFVLGGGNVFFAVDGTFVDTKSNLEARAVEDKGLLAMLANYGAVVRQALVLDRTALSLTFQTQTGNTTIIQTVRYPEWIGIREQGGNADHPLTARFDGLDLFWASPLELIPPPGIQEEALFFSTNQAWLQTKRFVANPNALDQFTEEADETRGIKLLGATLSGIFPGAYEGRPQPLREGSAELPALPSQKKPARIIVVGDADFAGSIMQVNRGEQKNLSFLIRAADWLCSDEDMVAIRRREGSSGRLDRIMEPEKRDKVMTFSRRINTFVIPIGVILAGLFLGWRRKTKSVKERGRSIDL